MTIIRKNLDEISISEKRLKELSQISDDEIDYGDIPELTDDFWQNATIRKPANKEFLSIRFDADIVAWFKKQGKGYQSRMNSVLRSYYEAHQN